MTFEAGRVVDLYSELILSIKRMKRKQLLYVHVTHSMGASNSTERCHWLNLVLLPKYPGILTLSALSNLIGDKFFVKR